MLKRLLVTAAAAALFGSGLVAAPAQAAPSAAVVSVAAAKCHAHKQPKKNYWVCITPGAYCAASAHKKIGYAKPSIKHRKYRCSYYSSNGRWRWKRA